jgi:hypothetical protein
MNTPNNILCPHYAVKRCHVQAPVRADRPFMVCTCGTECSELTLTYISGTAQHSSQLCGLDCVPGQQGVRPSPDTLLLGRAGPDTLQGPADTLLLGLSSNSIYGIIPLLLLPPSAPQSTRS